MPQDTCWGITLVMATQSFDPIVLLTRPAAHSESFAHILWARIPGVRVVISALMAPVFLAVELPVTPSAAVILTSQTGAEAAGRLRAHLPDLAYCVGDKTAEVAKALGFSVRSAKGDAVALYDLILGQSPGPLLHLRGREARGDLAGQLSASGVQTAEVVVYAQERQPLNAEAVAVLTGPAPVVAPLFSPRSADILGEECHRIRAKAPLTLIAMSPAVAVVARFSPSPPLIAKHPNGESMLEAVMAHLFAVQGA